MNHLMLSSTLDDERLQAGAYWRGTGHAGGEGRLAAGLAVGALLDFGRDTLLDHLKHDVVQDPAFALERSDLRQIGATAVTDRRGEAFPR